LEATRQVPERRKAMYKQMADERLKRTKEYAARKAAAEQAREEEMRVLLGKHDKLKAERAAQAAADEATRARQHVEGRMAACASLAAKLRFLKRAVVVARYRYGRWRVVAELAERVRRGLTILADGGIIWRCCCDGAERLELTVAISMSQHLCESGFPWSPALGDDGAAAELRQR
jgi:hypothetical protein